MPAVDPTPHSLSAPTEAVGVGTLLRQAREQGRLTLEQVAGETKIPMQRLAELERDDHQSGGERGFYERAQIRAYARAIKLGDDVVVAELEREATLNQSASAGAPKNQRPSARPRNVVILAFCVVVAAAIGRAIWPSPSAANAHVPPSPSGEDVTGQIAAIGEAAATPAPSSGASNDVAPASSMEHAEFPATPAVIEYSSPAREAAFQEAARPSVPSPAVTSLVIATQPPDARVTVGGIGWGATPITIRHLPPGTKRIRVTKDGYLAVERVVDVVSDRSTSVTIQMRPAR
jgi:cytoskeleton protein RodZ